MSKLIIEFDEYDDEVGHESTIEYIQSLVSQGYTSGYHPYWRIES